MRFLDALASLLGVTSLAQYVAADLRITADNFSFGGVNYPGLQTLNPRERDEVIRAIVKSGARVVRLFIQQYGDYPDAEPELGGFDRSILDMFDNTLAAIHRIGKGQLKVIISPHNAHALRGTNDVPCDAYCKKLDGAFLDFYSFDEYREIYKTRLQVLFKEYPSVNFGGRPWGQLNEIILGVDIQNQPFSSIHPIPAGEGWICDIATHLHDTLKLSQHHIAVISGGISGPQSVDGWENFPDSAFECPSIDILSFHGYYAQKFKPEEIDQRIVTQNGRATGGSGAVNPVGYEGEMEEQTAGTNWAKMFVPGNTLTARALAKGKLLMVEEWAYVHTELGLGYKKAAIWDQGMGLNLRGIPWIYSKLHNGGEGTTSAVSILRDDYAAIGALKDVLRRARVARSNFNWTSYLPPPSHPLYPSPKNLVPGPASANLLSNHTHIPLNPFTPELSPCTFGCPGHLCNGPDSCHPTLICKNSICIPPPDSQPGKIGNDCHSKKPCLAHLRCEDGVCGECAARETIQPKDPRKKAAYNAVTSGKGMCKLDYPFRAKNAGERKDEIEAVFRMRPICLAPLPFTHPDRKGNPCENAQHCDANEYCDWGTCRACTEGMGCLGAKCKGNNACKTGYCNSYGRCDYPGQKRKRTGPGASARKGGRPRAGPGMAPEGAQRKDGAAKVRSEALRVHIPKEKVPETGGPKATATGNA